MGIKDLGLGSGAINFNINFLNVVRDVEFCFEF